MVVPYLVNVEFPLFLPLHGIVSHLLINAFPSQNKLYMTLRVVMTLPYFSYHPMQCLTDHKKEDTYQEGLLVVKWAQT